MTSRESASIRHKLTQPHSTPSSGRSLSNWKNRKPPPKSSPKRKQSPKTSRSPSTPSSPPCLATCPSCQARRQEQERGYHEPPAFIRPAAEIEADLLLTAGQPKEAEAAWQLALEDRPNSGFPLYGLARAAEDSRDNSKTQAAYRQFLTAWKTADPELPQVQHAQAWLTAHSTQTASIGEN